MSGSVVCSGRYGLSYPACWGTVLPLTVMECASLLPLLTFQFDDQCGRRDLGNAACQRPAGKRDGRQGRFYMPRLQCSATACAWRRRSHAAAIASLPGSATAAFLFRRDPAAWAIRAELPVMDGTEVFRLTRFSVFLGEGGTTYSSLSVRARSAVETREHRSFVE